MKSRDTWRRGEELGDVDFTGELQPGEVSIPGVEEEVSVWGRRRGVSGGALHIIYRLLDFQIA